MSVTYGSARAGVFGRVYDRLRKRAYRATVRLDARGVHSFLVGHAPWDGDWQQHGVDLAETYTAGVRDALNAVSEELHE